MEGSDKRLSLEVGRSLRSMRSISPSSNLMPASTKSITGSSELSFPSGNITTGNTSDGNVAADINALPSSAIINNDVKGKEQEKNTKKTEKTAADCLNLVSKACFRKVPPSSFYMFFPPKSSDVEYPRSPVSDEKDTSTTRVPAQRGILHDDKLFADLNEPVKPKIVGFGVDKGAEGSKTDALLEPLDGYEKEVKTKARKKEAKKRMGSVPSPINIDDSVTSALSKVDQTPLPEKKKPVKKESTIGHAEKKKTKKKPAKTKVKTTKSEGEVTKSELQIEKDFEDEAEGIGLTEVILQPQAGEDEPDEGNETREFVEGEDIGLTRTTSSELEVWMSGRIVGADQAGTSPLGSEAPRKVLGQGRVSETSEDSSSSSSSSETGVKTSVAKPTELKEEPEQKEVQPPPIVRPPSPPKTNPSEIALSQSFAMGNFSRLAASDSFMTQGGGSLFYPLAKLGSEGRFSEELEPHDVLQVVSSCTVLLLKTYSAMIEHKSDEEWAPIRDLMSTMSYDELTSKRPSLPRDEIKETKKEDETNHEKGSSEWDEAENIIDSISSIMMGSDVTPSDSSPAQDQKEKIIPDNFSGIDFMKRFCSDWGKPSEQIASTERGPEGRAAGKGEPRIRSVSEALEQIDPDATYDVIFTYELPKTAPFDLDDSLADVRFNRVQKWLNETANTIYASVFNSEIKGKREEKYIKELLERLFALQEKVKYYEDLRKNPRPKICSPSVSSKSTFGIHSLNQVIEVKEEEESPEEISEPPSDSQIERALVELKVKLAHSHADDSEVIERKTLGSVDIGKHQSTDKSSHSNVPIYIGAGSKRYTSEKRGSRKRREIKELIVNIIEMLEVKLERLKYLVDDRQSEETEDNRNLVEENPSKTERGIQPDESSIPRTTRLAMTSSDNLIKEIEEKLKRDFFIGFEPKIKSKKMEKSYRGSPQIGSEDTLEVPTCQQRLQLYLLGLTDTWRPKEDDETSSSGFDLKGKRLLSTINKEDIQAGIRHMKHQKKLKYLPNERKRSSSVPSQEKKVSKSELISNNKMKPPSSETNQHKNITDQVPFTCKCLCDRVSRFNPKRSEHFRTVLNENLWCLRSNSNLLKGKDEKTNEPIQENGAKKLCPPDEYDEPDNFRGWLADTDRNLLLLFNRSPLDRLNKDYYEQPATEIHQPSPEPVKDDAKTVQMKHKIEETLKKIGQVEAEKFWVQFEQWYDNFKKCDKTRQLINEFENMDINAMMKRDLGILQEEMKEKLKADKMKIQFQLELIHRKKFFENLKKLRDEYECGLRNRLAAKEKEMEAKKEFTVQTSLREMKEKFGPIKEEHKKRCIEWMKEIRDRTNATSQTVKQRQARELALVVEKMDVAERTRKKLIAATQKEHESLEETLCKAVQERDLLIDELNRRIENLTRDVGIWKRAVREVLNSFKKFMYYILETSPDRTQYVLSLEKLYQIQMDDMIRAASEELEKVEASETKLTIRDELQPTMEIKCPSHDIRYPSGGSTRTGSSSDTDIGKDIRDGKVADYVVQTAMKAVLPTPEMSADGEDDSRIKKLEEMINDFVAHDSEVKTEPVSTDEICEDDTEEPSRGGGIVEDTSDPEMPVEEFTRRRIRDMLKIIYDRKPQIKGHIHL